MRGWRRPGNANRARMMAKSCEDQDRELLDAIEARWNTDYGSLSHDLRPEEAVFVGPGRYLRLATGGWSDNENLIDEYEETTAWWFLWCLSARGGLYILRDTRPEGAK